MSNNDPKESREPINPEPKVNIHWVQFKFIAPYIISLIYLLVIFYFFPRKRIFQFISFIFFLILALWCIIKGQGDKFREFYFAFFYLPIYVIYLF